MSATEFIDKLNLNAVFCRNPSVINSRPSWPGNRYHQARNFINAAMVKAFIISIHVVSEIGVKTFLRIRH
jgi:hypothetical protein